MEKLKQGNWKDLEPTSKEIKSVQRLSDGQVFKIGDFVTNGTQMRGRIEEFHKDDKTVNREKDSPVELYVITDWSGIGMDLDSIHHIDNYKKEGKLVFAKLKGVKGKQGLVGITGNSTPEPIVLPSQFQPDDFCGFKISKKEIIGAQVTKVSFTKSKVLYDLEIGTGDGGVTRMHSIDSAFVVRLDQRA